MTNDHAVGAVPGTGDEITLDWFRRAIDGTAIGAVAVDSIEVEPLPNLGFMCDIFRVTPVWVGATPVDVPPSFLVKIPPLDPGGAHVGAMLDAWGREAAFYRHVAPQTPGLRLPRCFHIGEDRPAGRWALLLEELPSDGVTDSVGATPEQASTALEALSVAHAAWWQSSTNFEWMPGFDGRGVGGLQPLWLETIPTFLERYGHLVPAETAVWLTTFAPRLSDWSNKTAAEPLTIVHADYRADNLIFFGDQVTVIDWQTALRGPAAMDVSSFLATSMATQVRRAHEATLISAYLDHMQAAGIVLDREWFEESLDENLLWWMGQFANNLAHLHPGGDAQDRLDLMVTRTYQMAADRNVGRLLV